VFAGGPGKALLIQRLHRGSAWDRHLVERSGLRLRPKRRYVRSGRLYLPWGIRLCNAGLLPRNRRAIFSARLTIAYSQRRLISKGLSLLIKRGEIYCKNHGAQHTE
jgi:hypothetical protein